MRIFRLEGWEVGCADTAYYHGQGRGERQRNEGCGGEEDECDKRGGATSDRGDCYNAGD